MFAPEFTDKIADQVIEVVEKKLEQKQLPPTLNGTEAAKFIGVSSSKFNEIIHMDDFQFVKIKGISSRYSTANLIKWINGERRI